MELLTSALTEGQAYFDEERHEYWVGDDENDVVLARLLSGSQIAERYKPEFPREVILNSLAAKHGVDPDVFARSWDLKRDASLHFGNAVHTALQAYGEGLHVPGKEVICAAPFLNEITRDFFTDARREEEALYESFVINEEHGTCGLVDRVVVLSWDERVCVVEDVKTNADLHKGSGKLLGPFSKLPNTPWGSYTIQLNAYAEMLEAAGWTVEGLTIHHLKDGWKELPVDRVKVLEHL